MIQSSETGSAAACAAAIEPVNDAIAVAARGRIDQLTKPLGALGRIETLAVQLCAIAGTVEIATKRRAAVLVGAGDHGVSAQGVSAYPAEVTPQMVAAFTGGFAAINAFARTVGAELFVADFGVRVPSPPHPSLIDVRVGPGTADFALGPAMTLEEVDMALDAGVRAFETVYARSACEVIALGEMGIANTTSAAAMIAAFTHRRADEIVGRGTGVDDVGLQRKIAVVDAAAQRLHGNGEWRSVASEVGGFEIVGLAGVMLAAARRRIPIVLDGFIVSAAALLASRIAPLTRGYFVAAHLSQERGHRIALDELGLRPLLDLELRLGEGTGAALVLPMIEAASRMVREMKTFAEAGVATAT